MGNTRQDLQHRPSTRVHGASGAIDRRCHPSVFGLRFHDLDVAACADHMLGPPRRRHEGVGLFATPNIQHIALARRDAAFAAAMAGAQIVVADGFPVYRFAKARGVPLPGRVTGREVIARMFEAPDRLAGHRGFFVVDSDETATLIADWVAANAPDFAFETCVPPFGFDRDIGYCTQLAGRIARAGTTLLFLCVGAPKSELFVHRYRALLPPCWALCVGQSFRLILGTTAPPPALMVRLNLEWLWRIVLEPRRMLRRYGPSAIGFVAAMVTDLRRPR